MNLTKKISLYVMILFYIVAGINHFVHPLFYKNIMPPWLCCHYTFIFITGIAEVVFGIMLLADYTRRMAAWCIIALLVIVFPANVQMMINYLREHNQKTWVTIVRLPIQILLVWWAYTFAKKKVN